MAFATSRRNFLLNVGAVGLTLATTGLARPFVAHAESSEIRIVSNPGLENATLNALMNELGYFRKYGVNARIIEANGPTGPFDAIVSGSADVCMVSGYNLVLSRIEQGAPVKIVGAGMRKCALSIFARPDGAKTLNDLKGKTVAVGPKLGLLHTLTLQLLKERRVDASTIKFVDYGSNEQCFDAAARGLVDACCASISHLNDNPGLAVIDEGNMWRTLPNCVFQTAYASNVSLDRKHEGLVAVMAAYGALYEYLMSPDSHDAFMSARMHAMKKFDSASANATWNFYQTQHPYMRELSLTEADVGYLQDMDISAGSLKIKQPFHQVADMSAANAAVEHAEYDQHV